MKISLNFSKLSLVSLAIFPLLLAFLSYIFFENSSKKSLNELSTHEGNVAGAATRKEIRDLSKEIPIIPNAEVASVDTSNNKASITLETNQKKTEIETFYDDYLFINGWKQTGKNVYKHEGKVLTVDITKNIVRLTLVRDDPF